MTLWELRKKQSATVDTISSRVDQKVVARLEEMGMESGQRVTCLRRTPFNGPTMVELGGSAFALEQAIAECVLIRPETD